MSQEYYYLVAGLPDLLIEDKKVSISIIEFRNYLAEHLDEKEMEYLLLYFWQFDNTNVLSRLNNQDGFNPSGNLSSEQIDELIAAAKDSSFDSLEFNVPDYLIRFIEAFKNDHAIFSGKSWELQLTELYYHFITKSGNQFISNWFDFEKKLNNVVTAINCRNSKLPIDNQIVGSGEIVEKLQKSSARDFGLNDDDIPEIDRVFKALDSNDLLEQEKRIDTLRWELLDDWSFFHYFSLEKLFVFLIKLSIIERWMSLDKTKGLELFKELLNSLETSYEFPADFSLK